MRNTAPWIAILALATAASAMAAPSTVSPGGRGELLPTTDGCPTFSWGGAAANAGYELAVFELPGDVEPSALALASLLEEAPLRLGARLPAGTSSWTPPADRCLESGRGYAWFLRTMESEEWSEGRFFEVATDSRLERAVERVLLRFLADRRISTGQAADFAEGGLTSAPELEPVTAAAIGDFTGETRAAPPTINGKAAIFGEQTDTTGITFGVKGKTNSGTAGSAGVLGHAPGTPGAPTSGVLYGVRGVSESTEGRGVAGEATATVGVNYGVLGTSASSSGTGVLGVATSDSGEADGVHGSTDSAVGFGGRFESQASGGTALLAAAKDGLGSDIKLKSDATTAPVDTGSIASDHDISLDMGLPGKLSMTFGGVERASLDSSGTLTATKFEGDGSALLGVTPTDLNCMSCVDTTEIEDSTILFADLDSNSCATDEAIAWNGLIWTCQTFIKTIPDDFVKRVGDTMTGGLILDVGATNNAMFVKSGNVGIGVDPPAAPLHVAQNALMGSLKVEGLTETAILTVSASTTTQTLNVSETANAKNLVVTEKATAATFEGMALECPDCVDTADIGDTQVTKSKLAENSVDSTKIEDNTIQLADIGVPCQTNQVMLYDGTKWTCQLLPSDPAEDLQCTDCVNTSEIENGQVTTADLMDAGITTAKILDLAITSPKINDSAVTAPKVAANAVTTDKLANNAVNSAKIADGTILLADIGQACGDQQAMLYNQTSSMWVCGSLPSEPATDLTCTDCVSSSEIVNGQVMTADLMDSAVTEAKIGPSAVTTGKIFLQAVTADKIGSEAVEEAKIKNLAVTNGKIANLAVTTSKINNDAVTNPKIADDAVTSAKIADDAVTSAKIGPGQVNGSDLGTIYVVSVECNFFGSSAGCADVSLGQVCDSTGVFGLRAVFVDCEDVEDDLALSSCGSNSCRFRQFQNGDNLGTYCKDAAGSWDAHVFCMPG